PPRMSGSNGIQSHTAQNIPRTHLSAVFISDKSVRSIFVKFVHNIMNLFLGFFRFSDIVVQISYVMTRLVSVSILPNQPRNIYLMSSRSFRLLRKHQIEFFLKGFVPSVELNHSLYIVWNKKRILPRV